MTYYLQGPSTSMYLITLQSSTVVIEQFRNRLELEDYCRQMPGPLPLDKWPESCGAVIKFDGEETYVKDG